MEFSSALSERPSGPPLVSHLKTKPFGRTPAPGIGPLGGSLSIGYIYVFRCA